MAWTITVRDKSQNGVVALRFDDGAGLVYDVDCHIPIGAVETFVADFSATTIKNLDSQKQALAAAPAQGETVTPTPDPEPPTVDQQASSAYQQALAARKTVIDSVAVGALAANDPLVQQSLDTLKEASTLVYSNLSDAIQAASDATAAVKTKLPPVITPVEPVNP